MGTPSALSASPAASDCSRYMPFSVTHTASKANYESLLLILISRWPTFFPPSLVNTILCRVEFLTLKLRDEYKTNFEPVPTTSYHRICTFIIMKTSSILSTLVALPLAWGSATYTTNGTYNFSNLTVALVRAPPANWPSPFWNKNWTDTNLDLNATVEKGVSLISQAASDGANLVIFPELWFAG